MGERFIIFNYNALKAKKKFTFKQGEGDESRDGDENEMRLSKSSIKQ